MKLENQKEEWRDIPGYEGFYSVSSLGDVMSVRRSGSVGGTVGQVTEKGYRRVLLSKENKRKNMSVHRAVAMAFLPNPGNLPMVNHKDGDKENNNVENLEWCDHKYNCLHATKYLGVGTGERNGMAKLTQREVDFIRHVKYLCPGLTATSISKFYGMSDIAIMDIISYKSWNHTTPEEVNTRLNNQ